MDNLIVRLLDISIQSIDRDVYAGHPIAFEFTILILRSKYDCTKH